VAQLFVDKRLRESQESRAKPLVIVRSGTHSRGERHGLAVAGRAAAVARQLEDVERVDVALVASGQSLGIAADCKALLEVEIPDASRPPGSWFDDRLKAGVDTRMCGPARGRGGRPDFIRGYANDAAPTTWRRVAASLRDSPSPTTLHARSPGPLISARRLVGRASRFA
jgi:hypothetical protein